MKWFYLTGEKEVGPLTETAMMELTSNGAINEQTQVRREDMRDWQAFSTAFTLTAPSSHEPEPASKNSLFKFECPHCQQHISTDEDYTGSSVQCPTCGEDFVVPSLNGSTKDSSAVNPIHPEESVEPAKNKTSISAPGRLDDSKKAGREGVKAMKGGAKVGWVGLKRRSRQAALVGIALILIFMAVKIIFPNPLDKAIKNALPIYTKSGGYANLIESVEKKINNETYYIYHLKNNNRPFTGYIKDYPNNFYNRKNIRPTLLLYLKNGIVKKTWHWYYEKQDSLCVAKDLAMYVVYKDNVIQSQSHENIFYGMNLGDCLQGEYSYLRAWDPNGDIAVENGTGETYAFPYRQNNEFDSSTPDAIKFHNGRVEIIKDNSTRKKVTSTSSGDLESSRDFATGFTAGATGSSLPYDDQKAYDAGREYGKNCKTMPAYTQGYNTGIDEGQNSRSTKLNPYNELSQKVNWLAWNYGYNLGYLKGSLSR